MCPMDREGVLIRELSWRDYFVERGEKVACRAHAWIGMLQCKLQLVFVCSLVHTYAHKAFAPRGKKKSKKEKAQSGAPWPTPWLLVSPADSLYTYCAYYHCWAKAAVSFTGKLAARNYCGVPPHMSSGKNAEVAGSSWFSSRVHDGLFCASMHWQGLKHHRDQNWNHPAITCKRDDLPSLLLPCLQVSFFKSATNSGLINGKQPAKILFYTISHPAITCRLKIYDSPSLILSCFYARSVTHTADTQCDALEQFSCFQLFNTEWHT